MSTIPSYPVTVFYVGKTAAGSTIRLELIKQIHIEPRQGMIISARNRKRVSSVRIAEVEYQSLGFDEYWINIYAIPDDRVVSYVDEIRDDFSACGWIVNDTTQR